MKGVAQNRKTIYPPGWVQAVVGASTPSLHMALACWATQLLKAVGDNAGTFGGGDWYFLRKVFAGFSIDPAIPEPAGLLAGKLASLLAGCKTEQQDNHLRLLIEQIAGFDYAHAHALLAVIRRAGDAVADKWWTKEVFAALQN